MATIIYSKPVGRFPGDTLRVMLRDHRDEEGETWPSGTTFEPSKGGRDNNAGCDYQSVVIDGRTVTFIR